MLSIKLKRKMKAFRKGRLSKEEENILRHELESEYGDIYCDLDMKGKQEGDECLLSCDQKEFDELYQAYLILQMLKTGHPKPKMPRFLAKLSA